MSLQVQTVDYDTPVAEALRLMAEDKFSALPVIDADGRCVGMLSHSDLSEMLLAEDQKIAQLQLPDQVNSSFIETCGDRLVREVMTHEIMSVTSKTTIKTACKLMVLNKIHHLPVVNDQGVLEGIVSTFDMIDRVASV